MLEQEREGLYWRTSLFLIFLSPWILYCLSKLSPNPFVGLSLFKLVVIVGMVASNVVVILLEMLCSRIVKGKTSFKFWVVKPSVECRSRA